MYVLDTSSLRGISKSKLIEAQKLHDLAISPITFYELLSHLDETNKEMTFERQKGLVMKCQLPRILNDPYAYHAITVGAEDVANKSRFEEPAIISRLLHNLDLSSSLEEFYASSIDYRDGKRRQCRDISQLIRDHHLKEKRQYIAHLNVIKDEILAEYPKCHILGLTTSQLADVIASCLRQMIHDYKHKDGITDEYLPTKVTSSMYMHYGYKVVRVVEYIQKAYKGGANFNPAPNDCEDSLTTMHLELFKDDVLVSGDNGTLVALNAATKAYRSHFGDKIEIKTRAVSNILFLNETQGIQPDN